MSEALEAWSEFNVAMVGATAALAGLLIVAMSVNIGEIMKSPILPPRAASSIATLVLAIMAGALGLMPGQLAFAYGIEVLAATLVASVFTVHAIRMISRQSTLRRAYRFAQSLAGLVPIAAFVVGGMLLLVGSVPVGLVAIGLGSVLAVVFAIIMAWVVLVEVLR